MMTMIDDDNDDDDDDERWNQLPCVIQNKVLLSLL